MDIEFESDNDEKEGLLFCKTNVAEQVKCVEGLEQKPQCRFLLTALHDAALSQLKVFKL